MNTSSKLSPGGCTTRRQLLKLLASGAAGAGAGPSLFAATPRGPSHRRRPVPLGLTGEETPDLVWDVALPTGTLLGPGSAAMLNGRLIYPNGVVHSHILMHDMQTGELLFQSNGEYLDVQGMRMVGANVYFGGRNIEALNPNTGGITTVLNKNTIGDFSVSGDFLVFVDVPASTMRLVCFDPVNRKQIWVNDTGINGQSLPEAGPLAADGMVVFPLPDRLLAVDSSDGQTLWSLPFSVVNADPSNFYEIRAADGSLYFSLGTTLHAVDAATGTLQWSWTHTSNLSAPTPYNGLVYVADAGGALNALQASEGANTPTGKPVWNVPIGGGLNTSPVLIEDGIAYVGDIKVAAVDLTSSGSRVVTYTPGTGNAGASLIGVENGVLYFAHNGGKSLAAVDMAHQLHAYFCESKLMAEDYVASSSQANGYQPQTPSYRTNVRLLDPNSNPRVNKSVKVWASDTVTIKWEGQTVNIGRNISTWLQTDGAGELEIVSPASDVSTPALYLWGTFMAQKEAIVIYPDHTTLTTLSGVQGSDMATAKAFDGSDLMTDKNNAGPLAQSISNTMGGVAQAIELTRKKSAGTVAMRKRRHNSSSPTGEETETTATYIAFPTSSPNMVYQATAGNADRTYVGGSLPQWTTVINPDGSVSFQAGLVRPLIASGASLGFNDFLKNVVHGAQKIGQVVVNTTDHVYHTIKDDLGQLYSFVVDTVEKAVAVVTSLLKTVLKDIVKAVEWLSWLFNWSDMLATKDQIKTAVTQNINKLKDWLLAQQKDKFQDVHGLMRTVASSNGSDSASNLLNGQSFQSAQIQNNDPQAVYGASGAQSYTPSKSLQSKVTNNAGQGTFDTSSSLGAGDPNNILNAGQAFVETIESKLSADFKTLGGDLAQFGENFKVLIADPGQFVKRGFSDLIQISRDVAKTLLDFVDAVLEAFINGLAQILDDILALANTPIRIPIVSELWKLISHDQLTVIDLCALLAAVPTTIIEKAIHGDKVSSTAGTPPPLNQNIGYALAAATSVVLDALNDTLDFPDVGMEAYLIFGLSLLTQGLNFPDNQLHNPDGNQLLLYAVSWFPVAFSAFLFAASKAKSPLKAKVSGQADIINFTYGGAQLVLSSWIGVFDRNFAGNDNLGMIAGILSSVPYLAKLAATGPAGSPPRIGVGVIDGAFGATSLGLTIATW